MLVSCIFSGKISIQLFHIFLNLEHFVVAYKSFFYGFHINQLHDLQTLLSHRLQLYCSVSVDDMVSFYDFFFPLWLSVVLLSYLRNHTLTSVLKLLLYSFWSFIVLGPRF